MFIIGLYLIAVPFIEGFVWGTILVLVTHPVYRWLNVRCKIRESLAALIMSVGIGALILVTALPIAAELGKEMYSLSRDLGSGNGVSTEKLLSNSFVVQIMQTLHFDEAFKLAIKALGEHSLTLTGKATQALLESLFNIAVMIFSSFFFYLYGGSVIRELQSVLVIHSSFDWPPIFKLTGYTVKGVVYGALATAFAQGILAGAGYYMAGAPLPLLLGLATTVMSFVPFGAPLVYLPVTLYLIFGVGSWSAGLGLLIWGVLVVSTIDNILRPLFISQTINLPLLLVFVGVVGGILAFGLVGLFIGPVLIALAHTFWKGLVQQSTLVENKR